MINSILDLQNLVTAGFNYWSFAGDVTVKEKDNLLIFNYRHPKDWNYFERISRGLIVNTITGEIVARPFDKFFNWFEGGRKASGYMVGVTEKVDGSLGILYWKDNLPCIATRGSFDSKQALWATDFIRNNYDLRSLPRDYTFLFEIIYPDNRIVVDYGDEENLILLAGRNRFTEEYISYFDLYEYAQIYGFEMVKYFSFNSVEDILAETGKGHNFEGWVAEFSDGSRWKFKTDEYQELHRLIQNITFKSVLDAMRKDRWYEYRQTLPETYYEQIDLWYNSIMEQWKRLLDEVEEAFEQCPRSSRKEFALYVKEYFPQLSSYLFVMLDGKIPYDKFVLDTYEFTE